MDTRLSYVEGGVDPLFGQFVKMDSGDERAPLLGGGVSEKRVKKRIEVEDNLTFRESSAENEQPASQTEFFVTMLPFIILQVL